MSAKTFHLEILTPERQFFLGEAEAVTVTAPDGELSILAGHAPLFAPVEVGVLRLCVAGGWREAFCSRGFMEVHPKEGVMIFVQACEWPEDIDARRAEESKRRAEEKLRQKRSMLEYKASQMALARAMIRLRVTKMHSDIH